jgi:SMI1-KNR4 cell-wall
MRPRRRRVTLLDTNLSRDMKNITESGNALSADASSDLEKRLNVKLPHDYRAFLLMANGGRPQLDVIDVDGLPGGCADVQTIFGVDRSVATSNILWNLEFIERRSFPRQLLPVACDSGGGLFCLRTSETAFGNVVYIDAAREASPVYEVASDFTGFLNLLRGWK